MLNCEKERKIPFRSTINLAIQCAESRNVQVDPSVQKDRVRCIRSKLAGAIRNYLLDALFWFEFWFRADNRYKRNLFRSPWSHHFMMVSLHGQVDVTITFMLHLHQCSTFWWGSWWLVISMLQAQSEWHGQLVTTRSWPAGPGHLAAQTPQSHWQASESIG